MNVRKCDFARRDLTSLCGRPGRSNPHSVRSHPHWIPTCLCYRSPTVEHNLAHSRTIWDPNIRCYIQSAKFSTQLIFLAQRMLSRSMMNMLRTEWYGRAAQKVNMHGSPPSFVVSTTSLEIGGGFHIFYCSALKQQRSAAWWGWVVAICVRFFFVSVFNLHRMIHVRC